jgi:hypothetical protein
VDVPRHCRGRSSGGGPSGDARPRSVSGLTRNADQCSGGSNRLSNDSHGRSRGSSRGRGCWRRRVFSSWRRTRPGSRPLWRRWTEAQQHELDQAFQRQVHKGQTTNFSDDGRHGSRTVTWPRTHEVLVSGHARLLARHGAFLVNLPVGALVLASGISGCPQSCDPLGRRWSRPPAGGVGFQGWGPARAGSTLGPALHVSGLRGLVSGCGETNARQRCSGAVRGSMVALSVRARPASGLGEEAG